MMNSTKRSGFTVLEMMIAVTILTLVMAGATGMVKTAGGAFRTGSERLVIENQGNRAMERIVNSIRLADRVSVEAVAGPPFGSTEVDFQRNLGLQGQMTAWSDPESIRYVPAEQSIEWVRDPNLPDEKVFQRCGRVAAMAEGETINMIDDNGNGLIDEPGFCLCFIDGRLEVFLTLEQVDSAGQMVRRSWSTTLRSRN